MAVLYSVCDREECDSALLMPGRLKKQNVEIGYRQERILSVTACGREILDVCRSMCRVVFCSLFSPHDPNSALNLAFTSHI